MTLPERLLLLLFRAQQVLAQLKRTQQEVVYLLELSAA